MGIASGELVELSTQQMTSCAPNPLMCGGNGGCSGSTPPLGYNYIQLFGHIKEEDYPYTSGSTSDSGSCQYDLSSLTPAASISGYDNLPSNDQDAVMSHIANVGPLAISVAANTFKDYHGGIFTGCDYDENIQLNHGVQLVGYGSEDGTDFWIVRNSWGSLRDYYPLWCSISEELSDLIIDIAVSIQSNLYMYHSLQAKPKIPKRLKRVLVSHLSPH